MRGARGISRAFCSPNSNGILASDLGLDALYEYSRALAEVLARTREIADVCAYYGVPLEAAALQFVLARPAVVSAIPGSSYSEHVRENAEMVRYAIPLGLWDDLRREDLISRAAPVPG
jgi:D-threo-aldose 1-dehydrogenase